MNDDKPEHNFFIEPSARWWRCLDESDRVSIRGHVFKEQIPNGHLVSTCPCETCTRLRKRTDEDTSQRLGGLDAKFQAQKPLPVYDADGKATGETVPPSFFEPTLTERQVDKDHLRLAIEDEIRRSPHLAVIDNLGERLEILESKLEALQINTSGLAAFNTRITRSESRLELHMNRLDDLSDRIRAAR